MRCLAQSQYIASNLSNKMNEINDITQCFFYLIAVSQTHIDKCTNLFAFLSYTSELSIRRTCCKVAKQTDDCAPTTIRPSEKYYLPSSSGLPTLPLTVLNT